MRAACRFARELAPRGVLDKVARVKATLYGSLALTGLGHATDRAVLLVSQGTSRRTSIQWQSNLLSPAFEPHRGLT